MSAENSNESEQIQPPIKQIGSSEVTVVSPHLTIARDRVSFPDGQEGEFTYVKDPYVATSVVPYDVRRGKRGVVLVDQYRYPSRSRGWEVAAGRPNPDESSEDAAVRELAQEAGLRATLWQQLPSQNTFIGRGNSRVDTYLAADLQEIAPAYDAEELIYGSKWFPMHRVHDMMMNGEINSSHTIGALTLADVFIKANPDHAIPRFLR